MNSLLGFRDKWRKTLNNWFRLRGKRPTLPSPQHRLAVKAQLRKLLQRV
jgi:hypothetical protein